EVGSRINLANASSDTETMKEQLEAIVKEKEAAAEKEDYEKAANLRYQEIHLQKQLDKAQDSEIEVSSEVSVADVELIVEEKTGIPVTKLQADEQEKLRYFAEAMKGKV